LGSNLQNTFNLVLGDVGSETTYLDLKAYRYVISQPCDLKVLLRSYINYGSTKEEKWKGNE